MILSPWIVVDDPSRRETARAGIEGSSLVGVDTEYDSFRYFREKLCLLQVSTDSMVYLFDPLNGEDFSFLESVFEDTRILKIFHAGDNDVRLLHRDYGFVFNAVFDTQRAASLLGSTALSLPAVLQEYLGMDMAKDKKIQRSRWDVRPLDEHQLHYAALDSACLIPLYRSMVVCLRERGMEGRAEEAFAEIAAGRWREKRLASRGHMRIDGFDELDEQGRKRLRALYRWRFEKARSTNKARFMILSDKNLLHIARHGPGFLDSPAAPGGLTNHQVNELGEELLHVLAACDGSD